jgi:hypothetical protein
MERDESDEEGLDMRPPADGFNWKRNFSAEQPAAHVHKVSVPPITEIITLVRQPELYVLR